MNYPLLNEEFPNFMAQYNAMYRTIWMPPSIPRDLVDAAVQSGGSERANVVGPISYQGQAPLQRDLDNFKSALNGLHFEEAFVPSATPSRNDADPSHVYSERAGLPVRRRRRDARRVQGDRRRRVRGPAGPRAAGAQPGAARQAGAVVGGAPPRLGDAGGGVQPRAAGHSRGPRALPPVLGQHEHARTPRTSR